MMNENALSQTNHRRAMHRRQPLPSQSRPDMLAISANSVHDIVTGTTLSDGGLVAISLN